MASRLIEETLDLDTLLSQTESPGCGALVIFGGTVRIENEGQPVNGITYTAYVPLAEKTLAAIEEETLRKFSIAQCRILHRLGKLDVGELSVLVVVRSAHRGDAFDAARFAIDKLKERVPIWKEEHYLEGGSRYLEGVQIEPAAKG